MQKCYVFFLLFQVFFICNNQAQTLVKPIHGVKLYSAFGMSYSSFGGLNYEFGNLSPAYFITRPSKHFTEISLTNFTFNNKVIGQPLWLKDQSAAFLARNHSLGLRLEHNYHLASFGKTEKWDFYLGGFGQFNYFNNRYFNIDDERLSFSGLQTSLNLGITPRLVYNLNKHWSIDFNMPINLGSLRIYSKFNQYDPTNSNYQSGSAAGGWGWNNGGNINLMPRIGLTYKF